MGLWDEVTEEYSSEIEQSADAYIKATNILPYTVNEISEVFTPEEMESVASFLVEMKQASDDNEMKAKIIESSIPVVEGLLKLSRILV